MAIVVFDIDGVVRDVSGSYRRALADTVEQFTQGQYRPSPGEIDALKSEGRWNNDWEASQELIDRYFAGQGQSRGDVTYDEIVAFFQSRYRGPDQSHPSQWTGYICDEPLLMSAEYLASLTAADILWGFFSGATTGSARFILETRMGLTNPVLIAMEDAPGKPDPTGLFAAIARLSDIPQPVIYVGDTVADMATIGQARLRSSDRPWIGVGVLPPHVQTDVETQKNYIQMLSDSGAAMVLNHVHELTPSVVSKLVSFASE